jgi:hypothetical protein
MTSGPPRRRIEAPVPIISDSRGFALFTTAFEDFRDGTLCERATLTIDRIPARWECSRCGGEVARGLGVERLTLESARRVPVEHARDVQTSTIPISPAIPVCTPRAMRSTPASARRAAA